jgi:hypothetical protein
MPLLHRTAQRMTATHLTTATAQALRKRRESILDRYPVFRASAHPEWTRMELVSEYGSDEAYAELQEIATALGEQ